ncbi:hypothetical protein BDV93DRAFT_512039 [Ceratobasidium sp. AG-I]|nr:hypothetical protein BDV93DRAFT_512039 [Ceratobasidium sp. AG-I]
MLLSIKLISSLLGTSTAMTEERTGHAHRRIMGWVSCYWEIPCAWRKFVSCLGVLGQLARSTMKPQWETGQNPKEVACSTQSIQNTIAFLRTECFYRYGCDCMRHPTANYDKTHNPGWSLVHLSIVASSSGQRAKMNDGTSETYTTLGVKHGEKMAIEVTMTWTWCLDLKEITSRIQWTKIRLNLPTAFHLRQADRTIDLPAEATPRVELTIMIAQADDGLVTSGTCQGAFDRLATLERKNNILAGLGVLKELNSVGVIDYFKRRAFPTRQNAPPVPLGARPDSKRLIGCNRHSIWRQLLNVPNRLVATDMHIDCSTETAPK